MDGNDGDSARPGERFRERHADEERPDEPGALGDRHRTDVVESDASPGERFFDDAADVADVLPRRELWDDTAPLTMDRHLRRDHVRAGAPGTRLVIGFFDHGCSRFVARRFDRQDVHAERQVACRAPGALAATADASAVFSDSVKGAVKIPRSVMMPVM